MAFNSKCIKVKMKIILYKKKKINLHLKNFFKESNLNNSFKIKFP